MITRTNTALNILSRVDNTSRVPVPPTQPCLLRDAILSFEYLADDKAFEVRAWGDRVFPATGTQYLGRLNLDDKDLYAAITKCRDVWTKNVVELRVPTRDGESDFPFALHLSTPGNSFYLEKVGLELARAGKDLFDLLFTSGDEGLVEIGSLLADAIRSRECVITVHSDDCFVPWRMLYTPPDPKEDLSDVNSRWEFAGFWGFKHVIEHQLKKRRVGTAVQLRAHGLDISLNVDEGIDKEFAFVGPVRKFFEGIPGIRREERLDKPSLAKALKSETYWDDVAYFGCHGEGAGTSDRPNVAEPSLRLTDGQPITRIDLKTWLGARELSCNPIVFINACQGGQMSSLFYRSFAQTLLASGAHCLVGAQVDLPAVFAVEFAKGFFTAFFRGNRRVGEIVRDLTRSMAQEQYNPLGLVYSLYHGLDTHLTERIG